MLALTFFRCKLNRLILNNLFKFKLNNSIISKPLLYLCPMFYQIMRKALGSDSNMIFSIWRNLQPCGEAVPTYTKSQLTIKPIVMNVNKWEQRATSWSVAESIVRHLLALVKRNVLQHSHSRGTDMWHWPSRSLRHNTYSHFNL